MTRSVSRHRAIILPPVYALVSSHHAEARKAYEYHDKQQSINNYEQKNKLSSARYRNLLAALYFVLSWRISSGQ